MARWTVALVILATLSYVSSSGASDLWGALGCDVISGSHGSSAQGAVALGGLRSGGWELFVGGTRFEDRTSGSGYSGILGGSVPLSRALELRTVAIRFADEQREGFRIKAGPVFHTTPGSTIGLHYMREDAGAGARSNGLTMEASRPVARAVIGRLGAGYQALDSGPGGFIGTAGATWIVHPRLMLGGELGVVGAGTPASNPIGDSRPLPLLGGQQDEADAVTQGQSIITTLSVRVPF